MVEDVVASWHSWVAWLGDAYEREIDGPGKEPLLLLLLGLVCGFVAIRTSTRLIRAQVRWWPGDISIRGVHVHHALIGVVVLLVSGSLGFTAHPGGHLRGLLALVFGVGAGLVLDEFALLLHLEDVYWEHEGRRSVDAVVVAVVLAGMLVVGANPLGLTAVGDQELRARWLVVALVVVNVVLTVVAALKGKPWCALLSVSLTVVGLVAASRVATPGSPWARYRYADRPELLARSRERERVWKGRRERFHTLVGGMHAAKRH